MASEATAASILDEVKHVQQVQEWWCSSPTGPPAAVSTNPTLACIEERVLAEVIASGGSYHLILSADRLDGLHRQYGSTTDPALESLRKALLARGGSKAQARALGMLLFKEARALKDQYEQDKSGTLARTPTPSRTAVASPSPATPAAPERVMLDEAWPAPRRFVCSGAYPQGAMMAARAAPNSKGEIVAKLPADFTYNVTGRIGDWLEVQVENNGVQSKAYVLHVIGDQAMLVCPAKPQNLDESWSIAKRWVKAEGYPEGAQMAAKSAPIKESKQTATLGPDFEYWATGRVGDFLQILLEIDGTMQPAFVLHTLGDLVLLKPDPASAAIAKQAVADAAMPVVPPMPRCGSPQVASNSASLQPAGQLQAHQQRAYDAAAAARIAAEAASSAACAARAASDMRTDALEAKVAMQERRIQSLQAELLQLRSGMASAASALAAASNNANMAGFSAMQSAAG